MPDLRTTPSRVATYDCRRRTNHKKVAFADYGEAAVETDEDRERESVHAKMKPSSAVPQVAKKQRITGDLEALDFADAARHRVRLFSRATFF